MLKAALAICIIVLPSIVTAQPDTDHYLSRAFTDCTEKAAGNTSDIQNCQQAEQRRWEDQLNATYQQTIANLSSPRQATLRAEERAWIKRRDADCAAAGEGMEGNASYFLEIAGCRLNQTVRRTLYLRSYR
jgi:uncharacterized protein YecT (DUF1311 family)